MTDTSAISTLRQIPNTAASTGENAAPAIRIPGEQPCELAYSEMESLVQSTANSLCRQIGLGKADVVSIVMPNTLPFVLSFLASTWASAVSAPLNPNYTESEYKFYMEDAESALLLVPDGTKGNEAAEAAARELGLPVYSMGWAPSDRLAVRLEHKSGPAKVRGEKRPAPEDDDADGKEEKADADADAHVPILKPDPDEIALFLHTSGTTARPKGVPLAHKNLVQSVKNIVQTYELNNEDATLLVMPLFHVHGLMAALLSTLATGGTVILPPEGKFSASHFWSHANSGKATWVTCVPTMYQVLLMRYAEDYPKNEDDRPNFRFVRSCSASLAPSVLKDVEEKFGASCLEAYAMTEASHQMCSNPLPKDGERKPGTVGRGTNVDVAIFRDGAATKDADVEGEVCIKGGNVMAGYKGVKPEVNDEAFLGGWFHTGDQGKLDGEGYLTLTGRIKELINRGGEKISPLEVDAAMLAHPSVAEAVSFAAPHDKYGEDVAAAVVLKKEAKEASGADFGLAEMSEFLKSRLAPFKIPSKLFVADSLPKTATGKIQRRIVCAHFIPS